MIPLVLGILVYTSCEDNVGSEESKTENIPFAAVYQKPSFVGYENTENPSQSFKEQLDEHVRKNFKYPEKAQENGMQGRVYVQFRIEKSGNVTVTDLNGTSKPLREEAGRIIGKLPKLIPGKDEKGNNVPVIYTYPIVFMLDQPKIKLDESPINDKNVSPDIPFTVVEQKPMFPGCEGIAQADQFKCFKEQLDAHVRKHFKYPEEVQKLGVQGKVYIQFRINPDGTVSVMNTRGPHQLLEDEAIRIINALPKLIPAKNRGKEVAVTFAYPIVFKLQQDTDVKYQAIIHSKGMKVNGTYDATAKPGKIYGKVTNEKGKGLPGVNIIVKGKNKGGATNFDGDFSLDVETGDVIVFQYKGLKDVEFEISEANAGKIQL